ncbi:hypothetical protein ABZ657_27170, partial [Streptomyces sp. NPDC007000]
ERAGAGRPPLVLMAVADPARLQIFRIIERAPVPVLCGPLPKEVKPSFSSPLRSPGSERKDFTYSA